MSDIEARMQAETDQSDFGVLLPRRAAAVAEAAVEEARQEERQRCIEIAKLHLEAMHELPDVLAALAGPEPPDDAMSLRSMREYEADDRG